MYTINFHLGSLSVRENNKRSRQPMGGQESVASKQNSHSSDALEMYVVQRPVSKQRKRPLNIRRFEYFSLEFCGRVHPLPKSETRFQSVVPIPVHNCQPASNYHRVSTHSTVFKYEYKHMAKTGTDPQNITRSDGWFGRTKENNA